MAAPKIMKQGRVVPWLYILPALAVILIFVVYPTLNTAVLSFRDRTGENSASADCIAGDPCWGAFENYRYAITHPDMVQALRNNALWLLLMVPTTVAAGLLIAVLADRVRYESLVKSIIFMPMAISFIGAGVIWRFMFHIETGSGEQIGVFNALLTEVGFDPVAWLSTPGINNLMLMLVGVWLWAGFSMSILSAALKGAKAIILAVPHAPYLQLEPDQIVEWSGAPLAVIDCFGILEDDKIRRYFELGCEVKALGRGHIQRIKEEVRKKVKRKKATGDTRDK